MGSDHCDRAQTTVSSYEDNLNSWQQQVEMINQSLSDIGIVESKQATEQHFSSIAQLKSYDSIEKEGAIEPNSLSSAPFKHRQSSDIIYYGCNHSCNHKTGYNTIECSNVTEDSKKNDVWEHADNNFVENVSSYNNCSISASAIKAGVDFSWDGKITSMYSYDKKGNNVWGPVYPTSSGGNVYICRKNKISNESRWYYNADTRSITTGKNFITLDSQDYLKYIIQISDEESNLVSCQKNIMVDWLVHLRNKKGYIFDEGSIRLFFQNFNFFFVRELMDNFEYNVAKKDPYKNLSSVLAKVSIYSKQQSLRLKKIQKQHSNKNYYVSR